MYKIKTLNSISKVIYDSLPAGRYLVSPEEPSPDAYLLRSFDLHGAPVPDTLLAVARAGAGVNNIPIEEMSRLGVAVFNTPGANANAVAELTVAGLLLAGRDIAGGLDFVKTLAGNPDAASITEKGKSKFVGPELRGKTLGVVGLGAIGALVANAAANGLGMDVVGYDPFLTVEHAWSLSRAVHKATSIEELLERSDYISFHIPLTDATRGYISTPLLRKCRQGARILNFSRGELAAPEAVKRALEEDKIALYVTDFPSAEWIGEPKVVCLPHLGASTPESEDRCAEMAAKELRDYLEKGVIRNSVNLPELQLGFPEGSRLQIIHENAPGLVSAISSRISGRGINILNMLNRSRGQIAVTVLELSQAPDDTLSDELREIPQVFKVRVVRGE